MTLVPVQHSAGLPAQRRPTPAAARRRVRSVCLYTCSFNPSGMGAHMLTLAEHYVPPGSGSRSPTGRHPRPTPS